jgi:hypothetical protein
MLYEEIRRNPCRFCDWRDALDFALLRSPLPKKWDAAFNRFCEGKRWDPKDLNPEQEQAARDAADSVLDALIQEGMQ